MTSHPPATLDDMIVSQIEWYLGRVNLEGDGYLKSRMDPESLWVDLSVILDFPKMQRMGVRDMNHVAHLLASRSAIVEVDPHSHRIRPAWAFRSTLVLSDVPTHATHDDLIHLLQSVDVTSPPLANPDPMSTSATHPTPSAPPVLLSVDPLSETKWIAIYDTPNAAQIVHAQLNHSTIKGVQIRTEPHMERAALRLPPTNAPHSAIPTSHPSAQVSPLPATTSPHTHSPSPSSTYPPRNNSHNPYMHHPDPPSYPPHLNPIMMHVPVIHPGSAHDVHGGYAYPSYVPPYVGVGVPRSFLPPRGMSNAGGGYMVPYGSGVSFDTQGGMVGGGIQSVQPGAGVDGGNGHAVGNGSDTRPGDTTKGTANGPVDNASGNLNVEVGAMDGDAERTAESYVNAGVSGTPVVTDLTGAVMGVQGKAEEQGVRELDGHHYQHHQLHRGGLADGSFGRGGSGRMGGHHPGHHYNHHHHAGGMHRGDRGNMQRGSGDGGRGGTARGGGGSGGGMDMQGRGPASRKGRKGNRNNSNGRHMHHGDRHGGDGRFHDGKGDGVGSPRDKDDRRSTREEKPKEPNFNSMNFPPLPAASDSASQRLGQAGNKSSIAKKEIDGDGADLSVGTKDSAVMNGNAVAEVSSGTDTGEVNGKSQAQDVADSETMPSSEGDHKDSLGVGSKKSDEATDKGVATIVSRNEGKNAIVAEQNKRSPGGSKKSIPSASSATNGSTMSYAAILISKKPAPPRTVTSSQRGSSQTSTRAVETVGSVEGGPNGHQPAQQSQQLQHGMKDRNSSRRRKTSSSSKNAGSNESQSGDIVKASPLGSVDVIQGKRVEESGNGGDVKERNTKESDNSRAKVASEVAPAHSAWANTPISLFQPGSALPAARTTSLNTEVRKTSSPVSSTESDTTTEKIPMESQSTFSHGGDNESTVTGSNVSAGDCSTNGAEIPDISHLSIDKGTRNMSHNLEVPSASAISSKKFTSNSNGNQVTPRGAWAAGGPKAWQKNAGNGVSERSSHPSES